MDYGSARRGFEASVAYGADDAHHVLSKARPRRVSRVAR